MARFKAALAPAAMLFVTACAPESPAQPAPPPSLPGGAANCDASAAGWAVGLPATDDTLERAQAVTGAERIRTVRPGEAVTMEFLAERLTVELDEQGNVRALRCG